MYGGTFGGYTRWALVSLIIFVLFMLLVPLLRRRWWLRRRLIIPKLGVTEALVEGRQDSCMVGTFGYYTQRAVVFLIIFVLFFRFIPVAYGGGGVGGGY